MRRRPRSGVARCFSTSTPKIDSPAYGIYMEPSGTPASCLSPYSGNVQKGWAFPKWGPQMACFNSEAFEPGSLPVNRKPKWAIVKMAALVGLVSHWPTFNSLAVYFDRTQDVQLAGQAFWHLGWEVLWRHGRNLPLSMPPPSRFIDSRSQLDPPHLSFQRAKARRSFFFAPAGWMEFRGVTSIKSLAVGTLERWKPCGLK